MPDDDRGLLLGDGLYETVLFREGEPVLWDAHLARLARGCGVLGIPLPDPTTLAAEAERVLKAAHLAAARAAVRLTWTAGSGGRGLERPEPLIPRLVVTVAASARPESPAVCVLATVRRNAGSPASRLKTLSYIDNVLARREAHAAGADEAVMLNTDGRVACAAAANLFWIGRDRLYTPALDCGVLDGMMRGQVIAAAGRLGVPVEEVSAPVAALEAAQALFLTNSLIGLRTIASLGGRAYDDHPLIEALAREVEPFI